MAREAWAVMALMVVGVVVLAALGRVEGPAALAWIAALGGGLGIGERVMRRQVDVTQPRKASEPKPGEDDDDDDNPPSAAARAAATMMLAGSVFAALAVHGCTVQRCPDLDAMVVELDAVAPSMLSARCSSDPAGVRRAELTADGAAAVWGVCPPGTAPGVMPGTLEAWQDCGSVPCLRGLFGCVAIEVAP